MSISETQCFRMRTSGVDCSEPDARAMLTGNWSGGDRRDRTDDLKLAKLPLSQLSYVPDFFKRRVPVAPANHGGPGKS